MVAWTPEFKKAAGFIKDAQLKAFEQDLKQNFMTSLETALEDSPDLSQKERAVLKSIQSALTPEDDGNAQLLFRYEETMPLSYRVRNATFHEALITLIGNKVEIVPAMDVFDALETAGKNDVAEPPVEHFRLWLIFAQINDFYENHSRSERLSTNICPADMNSESFFNKVRHGIQLALSSRHDNVILEAVENEPWSEEASTRLKELGLIGVTIALDDFGAPTGHNNMRTVAQFRDVDDLIVKLDGEVVEDLVSGKDNRLIDNVFQIKEAAPHAIIVAEWIKGVEDAGILISKLEQNGLKDCVHLAQGRDLTESARDFLWNFVLKRHQQEKKNAPRKSALTV